jgi:hypothetical protein
MATVWTTDCEEGLEDVAIEISLDVVRRVLERISTVTYGIKESYITHEVDNEVMCNRWDKTGKWLQKYVSKV